MRIALLLMTSALLASTARAQDQPPPAEPPAISDGDVIVTARRREESLQNVPIAVAAVTGATLSATGSTNVGRLTQLQPSLQFYSTNPRNSAANIRGLGAPFGLTNDGIEQGVGIYVDQVYYSRIAAATFDFIDVDRIEVLRGPQGTLYGKNTTAGAINITTARPSFEWEGRAELSLRQSRLYPEQGLDIRPARQGCRSADRRFGQRPAWHDLQCPAARVAERAEQYRRARPAAVARVR